MRSPRFSHTRASLLAIAFSLLCACEPNAPAEDDAAGAGGATSVGGSSSTAAGGSGGSDAPACDMWAQRQSEPDVFIGPTGLQALLVSKIDAAVSTVELMMYQLDCTPCVNALINAQARGVAVRVLLDDEQTVNDIAESTLLAARVPVQAGPSEFDHNHAKVLIIDGAEAVVMSANMNSYSLSSERNYGVVDHDPQDVAQLQAIFSRDWAGTGTVDTSCTRLIISPLNARQRILELISQATQTLDFGVMYISDPEIKSAIKGKVAQGLVVRVLLAMPEWIDSNAATARELSDAGAETRFLYSYELHAKLIVADSVPFVGSENMSFTSLEKNREIGLLVTEPGPASAIIDQFETDWSTASPAP